MKQPKTRANSTMTDAAFFGMIRGTLRRKSMHWKPIINTLIEAQRPSQSDNPRLKWEYQCAFCCDWHPKKFVEVDHIVDVGTLTCYEDLPSFVENLFCESDKLRVLCHKCHDTKTYKR
jgi:hypothetical protein